MPNIDRVEIRHPDLPGQPVSVPRGTLAARRRRGWVEVEESAEQIATSSVDESPAGDEPQPPSKED